MRRVEPMPALTTDDFEPAEAAIVGPTSVLEDRVRPVSWLPLLRMSTLRQSHLGLTDQGDWVTATPRRYEADQAQRALLYLPEEEPGCAYLVPLLEWTPSVVRQRVE